MGLRIKILILLLASAILPGTGYASWTGPNEVLSGIWGSNPGQFAIDYGDSGDSFPRTFCVNSSGVIAIADEFNSRVQTFKADGTLIASFGPQNISESEGWKLGWPLRIGCLSNGVYTEFDKYTQTYANSGTLILSRDNLNGGLIEILSNDNFISKTATSYYFYSPTGQLIKTSMTRPAELGIVEQYGVGGVYKVKVTYPDTVYQFTSPQPLVRYYRDSNKYLYQIEKYITSDKIVSYRVHKYTLCGKEISVLSLPLSQYEPMPDWAHDAPTWKPVPIMEYGEPLVSSTGDVYTWARTSTQYKILKWTWADDPNVSNGPDAPTNLSVAASVNGLYLTWAASPQDPGCVTGYEVSRATSAGGVGTTVGTVNAGTLKYSDSSATAGTTYYYKIRAVSGTDYSPYTNEVNGKR